MLALILTLLVCKLHFRDEGPILQSAAMQPDPTESTVCFVCGVTAVAEPHPRGIVSFCMCIVCDTLNLNGVVKLPTIPVSPIIPNPTPRWSPLYPTVCIWEESCISQPSLRSRPPVTRLLGLSSISRSKLEVWKMPRNNQYFRALCQYIKFLLQFEFSVGFTYLTLLHRLDEATQ